MSYSHRLDNTHRYSRGDRFFARLMVLLFLFGQQQIVVAGTEIVTTEGNGWTTTATKTGDVTDITNARKIGANSYNSFEDFGIAANTTVNFHLNGASNLVNLVKASRTDINGMLNAYMDADTIGGNLFFVNPHGITVGAGGVVNVGSLSMVVPTQSAMDDYISALEGFTPSNDDPMLFIGGLELNEDGTIDVLGTINAEGGVLLLANSVNVGGNVTSSGLTTNANTYTTGAELFSALVKVPDGYQDELGILEVDGDIVIGAVGSSGGIVDDLNPVKDTSASITISDGVRIEANGTIQISAAASQNPTSVDNGLVEWNSTSATVDVDGAAIISGSAAVVMGAKTTVELNVGGLNGLPISAAIAKSDAHSRVSVGGTSVIGAATDVSIDASSQTTISATANAESETATLTIAVANIDSDSSAVVNGTTAVTAGGAVTINSVSETDVKVMADGLLSDGSGGGAAIAITDVDNRSRAAIGGGAQVLDSGSISVTSSVVNLIDSAARSVVTSDAKSLSDVVGDQGNLGDNPSGDPDGVKANVDTALGDSFEVEDDGQASSAQLAAALAYTSIDSSSVAEIDTGIDLTGATVNSSGSIGVIAKSLTDGSNLAQGKTAIGADTSITAGVSILHSKEIISASVAPAAGKLTVSSASLNVAALNEHHSSTDNAVGEMVSIAYAGSGAGGDLGVAGAFAINLQDRDFIASVEGDGTLIIDVDGDLGVSASSNVSDVVEATATLTAAQAQTADDKFAANSAAQQDPEPSDETPEAGGTAGVGAAMAINVVTNTTDAHIGSGVTVEDPVTEPLRVTVDSNSKADTTITSKAGVAAGSSQAAVGGGASVAVSVVVNSTSARVDNNQLTAETVNINALHEADITVNSDGSAAGSAAAIGASIAISVSDTNTEALLVSNTTADSVSLAASSNSSNTTVAKASASGAEQEDEAAEEPPEGEKAGVDKQAADLTAFAGAKKEGGSTDDPESESAETPGGAVSVAAGLAVTVTDATVKAENTGTINTTGNTSITSTAVADSKAEADGSAVDGSNSVGIGAAVAVNTLNQSNTATARNITSNGGLTVGATQVAEEENDHGAVATSGAGGANVGVAGSVAVNVVVNKSLATYESGVVTGGVVDIDASNKSASKTKAGASVEGEGDSVGVGAGVAVDVAVNHTQALVATDADILGSDSVAVDAVSVHTVDLKGEAGKQGDEPPAGGAVGVSGAVAVGVYSNVTNAEIAASVTGVVSEGQVHIAANHLNQINVETDADAAGSTAAIGASIAISVSNADTEALISRDVSSDSLEIAASSSTANATKAKASASGAAPKEEATPGDPAPAGEESSVNDDVNAWQTFATDKDESGSTASTETEDADASSSEGQVSVAAAVAVTVTDVDTIAKIGNNVNVTSVNDVTIMSSANSDAQATADGSAANGDIGVGVGVAINVANNNNAAFISQGADVQGGNISVSAVMTEDVVEGETEPDMVNTFAADATSGAGAAKVGVAGSLGLNIVTNESRAYIAGNEDGGTAVRVYTDGELSLSAENNAKHVTKAQATVSGSGDDSGGVGIGASVAINTFTNKANTEIRNGVTIGGDRDVTATEAGSLTMASSSEYHSETKGEAGAEGEEGADPSNDIAVDAAVALVVASNETKTSIGDVDTSAGFSADIDLDATSNQSNTTEADGDSAGSSVAIGAVAAVNIGLADTVIAVNTDLKTSTGVITMDAASTSADKALAKASARGASKKKAQDKYGATEEEVDSGDFGDGADDNKATSSTTLSNNSDTMQQSDTGDSDVDSQSGDKGDWSVSVAAAVGANIVDNDTSIIVTPGKALAAGGSIDINASSDSNYMTLGSGEAVAVTDNSSSQGGIGIGVGVAITVAQNDTVAEVSSIEAAGDVSVTAKSTQNMNADFIKELTSEAIAGASADKVAVAGAVAVVVTDNDTRAEVSDGAIIGDIGALNVISEDQSKISSRAIAWVDPGKGTTAGVGASAAILVSKNTNTARIGDGVMINSADSINVSATNKRVTPATVGLNFSEIINFDDILESALLAGRTEASDDDEDNTGTEPEVNPETGGPAIIFDKLESKATDAKHALEDYIRSHNYYTEAAAGSASTDGSAKYGVAGSFAVTVLENETEASIGNVTIDNVTGNVDVTAETDTDIAGFTGSVVKAGKVGVGISATTLINLDSTRALVGNDSPAAVGTVTLGAFDDVLDTVDPMQNIGDLNVSASSDQDILGIGVSAAAASGDSGPGVAVSGVLNTTILVSEAEARIANNAQIYSAGSVEVDAEAVTDIVSVVGGIALGGKVGVGASVGTAVISGQTHAAIGDRAIVTAADSVAVSATANEDIISIVVGAGASKKVGVAGSLATNIIAASTTATIGTGAVISQTDARDDEGELNAISVNATDNTRLFSLAGGGAIGGKAGVGAAADVAVFSKNTVAETKTGSVLSAAGNVDVTAKSKDDIISLTGAGAASSSGAAVAGVASVKVVVDKTHALINSDTVNAGGNVDLLAQSDTDINIYDGTIAISAGIAGVGGAVAVNTIVKDTAARVAAGADITVRGDLEDSQVYNGDLDRSGYISIGSIARPDKDDGASIGVNSGELTDAAKLTSDHRGLSVTAFTTEDIETIGISVSASRSVSVAGNLAVDVIANTTEATIGAGVTVNATGLDDTDSSASVLVQAYDYTDLNAMLGSGAVGVSTAGVGAAGDVSVISKTTTAYIDANSNIDAEQDVAIVAGSEEDIDSIAAAVGVGSLAGVSGAASVLVINSDTRAYTASNLDSNKTTIDAGRDFEVKAFDKTDLFVFNTALAAGSTAGVGGSAGVVVMSNDTEARVGRGTDSNADRRTVVHADSDEKLTGIAMGAAGGGTAGVSGQLGVHVLASDTTAIVEDEVTINKTSWLDAEGEDKQSVAVIASNDVELLSISGTISLGGTAGVGGALTADVVKNHVRASVGNSEIYAGSVGSGNVDLGDGLVVEDGVSIRASSVKDITAVSVAGSGGGTAGVAGAASILIVGSDVDENDTSSVSFGGDMNSFISTGEGGEDSSQLAVADSDSSESRTGDTLGAQGNVEVSAGVSVAQYVDDNSQTSGSPHFALDSASGVSGDTVAVVASGAKIKTKGDLEISANDDTTLNVVGGSIAIGGTAGVAGAGALVLLNQGTRAIVQDDGITAVELDAAKVMNINARAHSQIFDVTATVAASGTASVSGSLLLNVVDSRVEASIGNGALVNQDSNIVDDEDQSVLVDANNSNNLVATTLNGSGSGTVAVGGVALVNVINSKTSATIGEAAMVNAQRDVKVIADGSEQVIANGASAAISGVAGVGGVINVTTINTNTEARIEAGAVVDSDGNVLLAAEDDTSLIANSWGVAIGVGGKGVGGSFGVNTITKNTRAVIAEGATVNARGNHDNMIDVYTGELDNSSTGDSLLDNIITQIKDESGDETQDGKWDRIVGLSGADDTGGSTPASSSSLGNGDKDFEQVTGLAVVASSTEDVLSSNASAAGGLYAGVSGSGQVLSVITDTYATVDKNVTIDASDVRLSAADHTKSFSLSGGLALSGVAGVGAAVANGNIIKNTRATLGSDAVAGEGVNVTTSGDVIVDAESSEDIDEILVNVAAAGIAGVGGGIGVHVVVSDTKAEVGNNAVVDAGSDLRVRANSNTEIDAFNGNLSIGGIAGVGAAVGTNVVANTTIARIGDNAITDAGDATEVNADSVSDIETITIAASGGAVGVAGGIQVNVVNTTAAASIGQGAMVNTAGTGTANQSVSVTAVDHSTINSNTTAIAVGTAAIGGAISVDILRNSASATVGSNASVNANNSIDVSASTFKILTADSASATAGGFGMSGSIAVAAIGGDLNDDANSQINGEDEDGNENADSGSINKTGSSSSVNPLASDDEDSQLNDFNATSSLAGDVDQRNADREANYSVSDDVAASSDPDPRSSTLAAIGSNATLKAGGDLNVIAEDMTTSNLLAGAVSIGVAAAGAGAASITVVENNTESMVASNAMLESGADLTVSAINTKTLNGTAVSGSIAGSGAIAGSAGITVDSSQANAHLDTGVKINQDSDIQGLGTQQNVTVLAQNNAEIDVKTGAVAVGLVAGIGGTINLVTTSQTTEALINVGPTGSVSAEGLIKVDADSMATVDAESIVGTAGAFGISGGLVLAFDDSNTSAKIEDGSVLDQADAVVVEADSKRTATTDTRGVAIGGIAAAGSAATVEMEGVTTASVAANAKLGVNQTIGSLAVDASATETASATALAMAGGILAGSGSVATTDINTTVSASTGSDTEIVASGLVSVTAQATPKANSRATGEVFGGATVGASVADVDVHQSVTAEVNGSDITAGSFNLAATVDKQINSKTADAFAAASSGGLLLGANATVSGTSVTGGAQTLLGANSILDISGNSSITATHNSDQYAETQSFAFGFAALGGAFSSGVADTVSTVTIDGNANITSGGSLTLNASGDDKNLVKAKSGSGGAVAGAAAVAETENTSITSVTVGNGTIRTANLDVDANHTARFDHSTDSTSGGLLGASGAIGDHRVDAQVAVTLAGSIEAGVLDARSSNNIYKNLVSGYNVNAGAGGLLGGSAADSETVISRMTSSITVAQDAVITSGEYDVEEIILEANNFMLVDDSAKLDSGGAIAIALAETSVVANNVAASVTVGDGASIETGGDLTAAAYSDLDVRVDSKASTYGLAGAAQGESTAKVIASNTIALNANSALLSSGETRLMAGRTADNQSLSQVILANTDLWNKTAFPVETNPEADAFLSNNNRVTVASESVVAAGGDIHLVADKGSAEVKGQGIGKDLYRQLAEDTVNFFGDLVGADDVSFDITGGSSTKILSETVNVDGTARAGLNNERKFFIIRNGDALEFYEGDYDIATTSATITVTEEGGVISARDVDGNLLVVTATADGYRIESAETGLSTTIEINSDFDPLANLTARLDELDDLLTELKVEAGVYSSAELTKRAVLADQIEIQEAEIAQLELLIDQQQNVVGTVTDPVTQDETLAGLAQIRAKIDLADQSVNPVAIADRSKISIDELNYWNNQVVILKQSKVSLVNAKDTAPVTDTTDYDALITATDTKIAEINDNLITHATEINRLIDVIVLADPIDDAAAITAANESIDNKWTSISTYSAGLLTKIDDYNLDKDDLSISNSDLTTQRNNITGSNSTDNTLRPAILRLEKEFDWISARVSEYEDGGVVPEFQLIDFTDKLTASSANVRVDADSLMGTGELIANRDTTVMIKNESEAYLRISGGAEIPFNAGGKVFLNNSRLTTGTYSNSAGTMQIGDPSEEGVSQIKFINTGLSADSDNTSAPGPDLIIDSDVSNYNGLVHLESLFGGVQTGAGVKVVGDTIFIKAGRDVVLSYTGGVRHIGGDVKCDFSSGANCDEGQADVLPGVIAGNSVYVAGEYLNINGKIQSGIPNRIITITETSPGVYAFESTEEGDMSGFVDLITDDGDPYFEVKPLLVAGGYVDLYGHIISTMIDPDGVVGSAAPYAAGEIQVLDGYGKVKIENFTDIDVKVLGINAGTGVEAKIKITDLDHDLAGWGNNKVTEYNYMSDAAPGEQVEVVTTWRQGFSNAENPFDITKPLYSNSTKNLPTTDLAYSPLAEQYYSWENLQRQGWSETRLKERRTYFGLFSDTSKTGYTSPVRGAPVDEEVLRDDMVLVLPGETRNSFATSDTLAVETGSWTSSGYAKNEYVVYRYEKWDERRTGTDYLYTKQFVAGHNDININFVGNDTGTVELFGNSGGGFQIAGDIRNPTGSTTILTTGDVVQTNATAIMSTNQLSITSSSVGEILNESLPTYIPLRVDIMPGGQLTNVNTSSGDIVFEQLDGDLIFGDIDANGDVWLKTEGNIINDNTDNTISGSRVSLLAESGAVGGADSFLLVNSEASAEGGLKVVAADDVYITETDGDLYLISATSSAGDVNIDVANGSLVDNNAVETRDNRTIEQLLDIWDEMEFITETTGTGNENSIGGTSDIFDVATRNVEATEARKTHEYQTYWNYRNALADPSAAVTDTTVTLSETEAEFFVDPDAVATERSDEFARLNELYGEIGNSFDETYAYEVVVGSDEYLSLTQKAGWTELELLAAFGPGLLKEISDTDIRIEDANATGNNINFTVQNGYIGTFTTDAIKIDLDEVADYTELSDEQKLALLTAERRDVRLDGYDTASDSYRQMWISTYDDVDVEVTGTLTAEAIADAAAFDSDWIYLGSEGDLAITAVTGAGDVRIRTAGVLSDSSGATDAAIRGKDIILEAGSQSIGSAAQAFTIEQLVDGSLTARAGDSIWLESVQSNPLAIDTVFATNLFTLKTAGDVVEFEPDAGVDIRADSVALEISGSFGAAGDLVNSIDVALNLDGILTAEIDEGAWITSPNRDLRIGSFKVGASSRIVGNGDLNLQSEDGGIFSTGGTLTLEAYGSIIDELTEIKTLDVVPSVDGARAIEALELDLIASNGNIGATDNFLDIKVTGPQGVWAQAENGSIYIESPDSDLGLRNVTAGDTSQLTTNNNVLLIESVGVYRSTGGTLAFEAGGSILDEAGDSVIEAVDLSLQAGNSSIGSSQRSLHVDTETISMLSAATGVYLTEISGDMNIGNLDNGSGDVVLQVAAPDAWLNISAGLVDGKMLWTANNMLVENLVHSGNQEELYFEVTSSNGGMADDVTIKYQSDNKVRFGNVEAKQAQILGDVNDPRFDRIVTGEWGLFSNDTTSVFVDNTNSGLRKEYTIQLTSQFEPYHLIFTPASRKIETDAYALYYDDDWVTNSFSVENSLSRLTQKEMSYLTGSIPKVSSQTKRFEDRDLTEINVDAVNLKSSDDTLLYLPPARDEI